MSLPISRWTGRVPEQRHIPRSIEVSPVQLINGQKTLRGHAAGTAREAEETMRFAAQSGVRPLWSGNGRASARPEGKGRR
jgi:D-arabinose 1-dehydrogenase-like Zn-dependent alcohol dehydrogenase